MDQNWFSAVLWLIVGSIATLLSVWLRSATALSKIVAGAPTQHIDGVEALEAKYAWAGDADYSYPMTTCSRAGTEAA
jgi:glutathione-regulated potassium-efflux system ancillary protein KefC